MSYDGIIGHSATLGLLRDESEHPGHAYLFAGVAGVGKATIAHHFAASLVCDSDRCESRVLRHSHPDVTFLGPDGKTALGVEQARAAIAKATLRPVESDRKVFIFDDASLMTDAAANALLKTLEEPSASTVFILIADNEDDLPDHSRQSLSYHPVRAGVRERNSVGIGRPRSRTGAGGGNCPDRRWQPGAGAGVRHPARIG